MNYGIILDFRYTQALLSALKLEASQRSQSLYACPKALPRHDALLTLLLFGKCYLSHPVWLREFDPSALRVLADADLVDWVPDQYYEDAFGKLKRYYSAILDKFVLMAEYTTVSADTTDRELRDIESRLELRDIALTDSLNIMHQACFQAEPVIRGNLSQLGYSGHPELPVLWPYMSRRVEVLADDLFLADSYNEVRALGRGGVYAHRQFLLEEKIIRQPKREDDRLAIGDQVTVLEALLGCLALASFASATTFPMKASARLPCAGPPSPLAGPEALQLVRVQFDEVRYPLIQTLDVSVTVVASFQQRLSA